MEMKHLKYERKDKIGIITLNNPPTNAINTDMIKSFQDLIPEVDKDPSVRCVIIRSDLDKIFMGENELTLFIPEHDNIRGAEAYD